MSSILRRSTTIRSPAAAVFSPHLGATVPSATVGTSTPLMRVGSLSPIVAVSAGAQERGFGFGFVGLGFRLGNPKHPHARGFAAAAGGGLSPEETKRRLDAINDAFAEAREEIECAMEAVGTTYFNEEAEYAQEVTGKVLEQYYALCDEMDPDERAATQRAMGMKMEQLKAELDMLDHAHDDD